MSDQNLHPFVLSAHPGKADPSLVGADVAHFRRLEEHLARQAADLEVRLTTLRRAPGGRGQAALDRDLEIHRLSARLRLLRRFGVDLCLGRMVGEQGVLYVGRLAVAGDDGEPLLIGWRAPAAEPFFGATHAHPMGLTSRRRYRWTGGHITDYWDEAFTEDGAASGAALDDQSAFIASLGASRSPRMRDVLSTIQADQDAIVRAGSRGALVVDGGPGTGKTVVALHRAAYLLYADPRLRSGRGGVLFIGPSHAYTAYVADILPDLGEEGVRTCTLADLLPGAEDALPEADAQVARLKADARMVAAVDEAVRRRQSPPVRVTTVETAWGELELTASDWAEAFNAADPASPHNDAREAIWDALLDILVDGVGVRAPDEGWGHDSDDEDGRREEEFDAYGWGEADDDTDALRRELTGDEELRAAFDHAWPLLDPRAVVRSLWTSPAQLSGCAPWLTADQVEALQRPATNAWTHEDLPLLDAARLLVGDPDAARRRRHARAQAAADRDVMDDVVTHLLATDDTEMKVMSMLRGQDLRGALATSPEDAADDHGWPIGPFAHIVVDEAQELTDAEWQMLLRRNPSRSFTVVGDRAQARHGFVESWQERLTRVGVRDVTVASLSVNYRTPAEVMAQAAPIIRAALPDANVPTSIRISGVAVRHGGVSERDGILAEWIAGHAEGVACVIGDPSFEATARVQSLSPVTAKGLEFDLVVLVNPERFGPAGSIEAAVDRYVSMTRATSELVVLTDERRGRERDSIADRDE